MQAQLAGGAGQAAACREWTGVSDNPVDEPGESGDPQRDPAGTPRYSRRLSDKILISFHQACDQNDFEVARQLLSVYEFMINRR